MTDEQMPSAQLSAVEQIRALIARETFENCGRECKSVFGQGLAKALAIVESTPDPLLAQMAEALRPLSAETNRAEELIGESRDIAGFMINLGLLRKVRAALSAYDRRKE